MNDTHFYALFFEFTNGQIDRFTVSAVAQIASALRNPYRIAITIYIILQGYSIMFGKIQEPIADSLFKLLRIAVISALAFNAGYYAVYVKNVAIQTPDEVAAFFVNPESGVGTNGGTAVNVLDKAFGAGWTNGQKFYEKGGFFAGNFVFYVLAILLWIATLLLTLLGAFMFLLARIGLSVLLAIGPIFIVLSLFEQTKRFTESWIGQLFNFMLLQIITAAVLGMTITLFTQAASDVSADALAVDQALFVVVIGLLTVLVLLQAPTLASGLAGGATLTTGGVFGFALGRAVGLLRAGAARTPIGRNLQAARDARAASRSMMANATGRQLNLQRFGGLAGTEQRAAGLASKQHGYRRQRALPPPSTEKPPPSATTSGTANVSTLREREHARQSS